MDTRTTPVVGNCSFCMHTNRSCLVALLSRNVQHYIPQNVYSVCTILATLIMNSLSSVVALWCLKWLPYISTALFQHRYISECLISMVPDHS